MPSRIYQTRIRLGVYLWIYVCENTVCMSTTSSKETLFRVKIFFFQILWKFQWKWVLGWVMLWPLRRLTQAIYMNNWSMNGKAIYVDVVCRKCACSDFLKKKRLDYLIYYQRLSLGLWLLPTNRAMQNDRLKARFSLNVPHYCSPFVITCKQCRARNNVFHSHSNNMYYAHK